MININKVIGNRSTFFSGGVTLCTRNVKYCCHLSVRILCLFCNVTESKTTPNCQKKLAETSLVLIVFSGVLWGLCAYIM